MENMTFYKTDGILLSDTSKEHLSYLREKKGEDLVLRVDLEEGGCAGLSYQLTYDDESNITNEDEVFTYEGVKIVSKKENKDLIAGLTLDYKDDLIGGGFKFVNPQASETCGCGRSFAV